MAFNPEHVMHLDAVSGLMRRKISNDPATGEWDLPKDKKKIIGVHGTSIATIEDLLTLGRFVYRGYGSSNVFMVTPNPRFPDWPAGVARDLKNFNQYSMFEVGATHAGMPSAEDVHATQEVLDTTPTQTHGGVVIAFLKTVLENGYQTVTSESLPEFGEVPELGLLSTPSIEDIHSIRCVGEDTEEYLNHQFQTLEASRLK